ncbi:hypothetical protein [Gracilinema caldarium]|uniref:Uncharacterized protein n=1 Tax=Gracilinema caldarium (strain ATCC 51460 / DSM 7334 / H1) TaxID=744872 RepID=F8EXQ5_GRAC1|nr:hypothetical protein [Gracilinema caldarium]AEJ19636.1 hypothetical protein Spica_1492 [Gracilinema caldarium DSM 7334]
MRRIVIFIFIISCTFIHFGATEENNNQNPFGFKFELGLGTETLPIDPKAPLESTNLATYQKLSLKPDISFGKIGVGLDVTVHFNIKPGQDGSDIEVYEPDWIPEKADKTFLELYLPKFAYIRYGQKGDALFAKFGSFDDGTLGNGFIMGNYSNTRFLPETRIFGGALDIDGQFFNFPYLGIETFVGNLAKFDVVGSRLYVRPFAGTEYPLLKHLQVGATVASDTDPLRYASEAFKSAIGTADTVTIAGLDTKLPVLNTPVVSMAAFSDLAFEPKGRWGSMAGVGGKLINMVLYGAQLRLLGPDFIPTYFDGSYDLFRHLKYAALQEDAAGSIYAGWLASIGFSLLSDAIIFQTSLDGPFKAPPSELGSINDYPHLRGVFTIAEGLLAGFSFDALYEKYYLGAPSPVGSGNFWKDLVSQENAVIGAKFNYRTGPAIISLLYNLRYDPQSGDYVVTSSLMSAIQF